VPIVLWEWCWSQGDIPSWLCSSSFEPVHDSDLAAKKWSNGCEKTSVGALFAPQYPDAPCMEYLPTFGSFLG